MKILLIALLMITGCGTDGKDGTAGPKGDPGVPGKDGTNGTNGNDGNNGTDNRAISAMLCSFSSPYFIIYKVTTMNSGDKFIEGSTSGFSGASFWPYNSNGNLTNSLSINADPNFLYLKGDTINKTATYQVNSGTIYTTTSCTVTNY